MNSTSASTSARPTSTPPAQANQGTPATSPPGPPPAASWLPSRRSGRTLIGFAEPLRPADESPVSCASGVVAAGADSVAIWERAGVAAGVGSNVTQPY